MGFDTNEKRAVNRVMDSGVLSDYIGSWSDKFYGGAEIQVLEKEWAQYFGVKHAIAINSATSGLYVALMAAGITPMFNLIPAFLPDEVLVVGYSMTCSASLPLLLGAKPVFVDIEPDYFCMDASKVEEKITPRTKAIIVVNLFGMPYDADALNAIAKKHGIPVIEDAAQSIGATYKGRYAGTLGDMGVFSLNFHKHIHSGEGGVIVTDNDDLAFKCRLFMNHSEAAINEMDRKGMDISKHEELPPGMNLRMTELSAAIAREQLKKLESIVGTYQLIGNILGVKVRPECTSAFYRYATTTGFENLDVFEKGMLTLKDGYITPLYRMPLFRNLGYRPDECPVCNAVQEKIKLAWMTEPF
jgi:perosamine synthetase